jgi:broad specificity phosphatase PhoE
MRFVFIRHGHYDKSGPRSSWPHAGLLDRGRAAARLAGEFLREQAIVPDLICRTSVERTRETAEIVLGVLKVERRVHAVKNGFAKGAMREAVEARLEEWAALADAPPATLAFVGHGEQQLVCLRELAARTITIPKDNKACVLVFDRGPDGWTVGPHHEGA